MKTIIAGSRTIVDSPYVEQAVLECGWINEITEVVCGGARGIDESGRVWAENIGIPVKYFYADWNTFGRAAGPIRNQEMAEYADALILIWDGESSGSKDMFKRAKICGLKIYEKIIKIEKEKI